MHLLNLLFILILILFAVFRSVELCYRIYGTKYMAWMMNTDKIPNYLYNALEEEPSVRRVFGHGKNLRKRLGRPDQVAFWRIRKPSKFHRMRYDMAIHELLHPSQWDLIPIGYVLTWFGVVRSVVVSFVSASTRFFPPLGFSADGQDRNCWGILSFSFPESWIPASFTFSAFCLFTLLNMDEKVMNPVLQQLGSHVDFLKDFIPRFFDHIDPESGPVKGTSITENQRLTSLSGHSVDCLQSYFLEFCCSFRFVSTYLPLIIRME